jgi:deoxyhypusine synthase
MAVREFVDEHFRHFNAGELAKTARSLTEFVDSGGSLMVTLAGAMSTAEMGRSLAPAIRAGKITAISCTGANLEEDLFNLVAHSQYGEIDDWRSLSAEQESQLENRITNRTLPEEAAIRKVESELVRLWLTGGARLPHEYLYELLLSGELEWDANPEDSWLLAAAKAELPLFVPGWEDSTLGNIFAARVLSGEISAEQILSGTHYMTNLASWYREVCGTGSSSGSGGGAGLLQVGGGIAGDFPICVVPMLRQDLGEQVPLWSWFAQISESRPSYGGYSGAPPNEKISWEKLGIETPRFVIESDATIVLPILIGYLLDG